MNEIAILYNIPKCHYMERWLLLHVALLIVLHVVPYESHRSYMAIEDYHLMIVVTSPQIQARIIEQASQFQEH